MNVTSVDRIATSNAGILHRLPVTTKLLAFAALLSTVLLTSNLASLAVIAGCLLICAVIGKLPLKLVLALGLYPAIFSLLLTVTTNLGVQAGSILLLKACDAALGAALITLSTPYPELFSHLGKWLPRIVNDSLLMTYRTLFILAGELSSLTRSLHLRGALSVRHPIRSLQSLGSALGNLVLFSLDLAQKDYDILYMRGYDGTIRIQTTGGRHDAHQTAHKILQPKKESNNTGASL